MTHVHELSIFVSDEDGSDVPLDVVPGRVAEAGGGRGHRRTSAPRGTTGRERGGFQWREADRTEGNHKDKAREEDWSLWR